MRYRHCFIDRDKVVEADLLQSRYGIPPSPCPFCQSAHVGLYLGPSPHMTCFWCGADGPVCEESDNRNLTLDERRDLAFRAWNSRSRALWDLLP